MPYMFTPPGDRRPMGTDRLWGRFRFPVSFAVLKKDGFYSQVETPDDSEIADADLAYLGGHAYYIRDTEAQSLRDAGYGAYLTLPPAGGLGAFGSGRFGVGLYGRGDAQATSTAAPTTRTYGTGPYGTGTYDGQG